MPWAGDNTSQHTSDWISRSNKIITGINYRDLHGWQLHGRERLKLGVIKVDDIQSDRVTHQDLDGIGSSDCKAGTRESDDMIPCWRPKKLQILKLGDALHLS